MTGTLADDDVTRIMRRAIAEDLVPTLVRPLTHPPLWVLRLRLLAAAAVSMVVAAALSCAVASCVLDRFGDRETILRVLGVLAAVLIILCGAVGGALAVALVHWLSA